MNLNKSANKFIKNKKFYVKYVFYGEKNDSNIDLLRKFSIEKYVPKHLSHFMSSLFNNLKNLFSKRNHPNG